VLEVLEASEVLKVLEMLEVMRRVLLCILEAVEGRLCWEVKVEPMKW